ncbi:class I SAM-dependent methyltransferase [Bacillus carboniphilus]|uniref:Class I SAM-dependent methyltransferase n=1 Tax=Bacillus carboniphilus TaxID=86663 RepID=A0ABY9JZZ7_9BACI|nr:class I SAM-dependent methyltransferase [Bacillus carboniphilus]WLR44010.1 class I SAM-dependent methyltransferase [Bacillus carboniphilus]
MAYEHFAFLYDKLMVDAPYDLWIEYVESEFENYCEPVQTIVDLGCGTGEISLRLMEKGFDVLGVDLSSEMLTVAKEKATKKGMNLPLLQQNMTDLNVMKQVDAVLILCDSLNYLENQEQVIQTFSSVYKSLRPGGLFVFDVHSIYKMENVFNQSPFVSTNQGISYIWNCFEGFYPYTVEHELTFFVEEKDHSYTRFDEDHVQRTFPIEEYSLWLKKAGFISLKVTSDFGKKDFSKAERIFFVAKKDF